MKVKLIYDELWPWFLIDDDGRREVEVPEETVERWKKASEDFFQAQREMEALYGDWRA